MKGNLLFFGVMVLFLLALVIVSSRPFLPEELKQPAPVSRVDRLLPRV